MSWFSRISAGLGKTAEKVGLGLKGALGLGKLDAATRDQLEESLLLADVGMAPLQSILKDLEKRGNAGAEGQDLLEHLAAIMAEKLQVLVPPTPFEALLKGGPKPMVIVLAGVNGAGKTTTLGKLAAQAALAGNHVVVAAADTFRAAAVEQLTVWADRAHGAGKKHGKVEIVQPDGPKADAASVAYRALAKAQAEGADVVLVDTAGRLPNRQDLLAELPKVARVVKKLDAAAPHHTWLVLDGTLGQSTLPQIDQFAASMGADMPLTGVIVTKLDGSAKAGFVLALAARATPLPIMAMGVGEALEDLGPFEPTAFARALVGLPHE
jgi:fused signal recognition particle receptor